MLVKSIKHRKHRKLYIFLSPVFVLFMYGVLSGIFGYVTGKATFLYHTQTNQIQLDSSQDFDHEFRVYYHDFRGKHYGPINMITGAKMYYGKINDLTIKALVKLFGYQNNMYEGVIPNPDEIYEAFMNEPIDSIHLISASLEQASFLYRNKQYTIRYAKNLRSGHAPVDVSPYASIMERVEDTGVHSGEYMMRPNAAIKVSGTFYPLLIVIDEEKVNKNNCLELLLIDLTHQQRFATYSIKESEQYTCTYCMCKY